MKDFRELQEQAEGGWEECRAGAVPTRVAGVSLHRLPRFSDLRGSVTVGEFDRSVPFPVKRYFLVFDVPGGEVRGAYSADWTWLLHLALLVPFVRVPETLCDKYYQKGSISKQWPHDAAQVAALWRAGVAEIRRSPLDPWSKGVLIAPLRVFPHLGGPVKRALRKVFPPA